MEGSHLVSGVDPVMIGNLEVGTWRREMDVGEHNPLRFENSAVRVSYISLTDMVDRLNRCRLGGYVGRLT